MLKGFRDFILRGNVIELAVAVVIGSAFTAIVTAITNNLVKPLVAILGSTEVQGFSFRLISSKPATAVDVGAIVAACINFLLIAAVVYFALVAPMNKLKEIQARRKGIDTDKATPASPEVELLQEIRDLLRQEQGLPPIQSAEESAAAVDAHTASAAPQAPAPQGSTPQAPAAGGKHSIDKR